MLGLATALNSSSLKKKSVLTNKFSAEFDGTSDYIDVSILSSDLNKDSGTISMWVRVQATSGNESFFNCSAGDSGDNKLVLMYNTSTAKIQANYKSGGTSTVADHSISNDAIVALGWFHLAMTYNVDTPLIQLFLNGTRVAQRTTSFTRISDDVGIDRVRLGSNSNADNTHHHGHIDEFIYISGKDLTETEMLLLYNSGKPDDIGDLPSAIYSAIKCWLRFGDGQIAGDRDQTSVIFDEKNSTLGSELVTDGDFPTGTTAWSIVSGSDADISGGKANFVNAAKGQRIQQNFSFTSNKIYKIVIVVSNYSGSGALGFYMGGAYAKNNITADGTYTIYHFPEDNTEAFFRAMTNSVTHTFSVDSITVKQIQGNPGFCVADATVRNNNVP